MPIFRILRGWGWICGIAAAELVFLAVEAAPAFRPAPATVSDTRAATRATDAPIRVSLQPVLDFQPFGAPAQAAAPPPADAAAPLPPEISLVLQGVLVRGDAGASRALISSDGGPARIYATGDILPGGGTLSGIESDRIWIDLDGEKQTLGFPDPGNGQPANEADSTANDTANPPAIATVETPVPGAKAPTMPQVDLQHLIPGLVADPLAQP